VQDGAWRLYQGSDYPTTAAAPGSRRPQVWIIAGQVRLRIAAGWSEKQQPAGRAGGLRLQSVIDGIRSGISARSAWSRHRRAGC
jgi:hypothetical protein